MHSWRGPALGLLVGASTVATAQRWDIQATIAKQIISRDSETGKASASVDLVTLSPASTRLSKASLVAPRGLKVRSFKELAGEARCDAKRCRQRFEIQLEPGQACRLDGSYTARFRLPDGSGHGVRFRLQSERFCGAKGAEGPAPPSAASFKKPDVEATVTQQIVTTDPRSGQGSAQVELDTVSGSATRL